jgi:hypothetical protein
VNGAKAAIGVTAAPVTLRQGRNTVILSLEVTSKNNLNPRVERGQKAPPLPGCSLALLDPTTGKRNRALQIGNLLDVDGQANGSGAALQPSVTIERPTAATPIQTNSSTAVEWYDPDTFEPDPLLFTADHEQEWWINKYETLVEQDPEAALVDDLDITSTKPKPGVAPAFPDTPAAREKAGWQRMVIPGEINWSQLAQTLRFGWIYALTHVVAPDDCTAIIRVPGASNISPSVVSVNGTPVTFGKDAVPVALHKGRNTVLLSLQLQGAKSLKMNNYPGLRPVSWLVLLDPATSKRAKSLYIGAPVTGVTGNGK